MIKNSTTTLFIASAAFIVGCLLYVYFFINASRNQAIYLSEWVDHSEKIISQVYSVMTLQEAILSEQRGMLLTGDTKFLSSFEGKLDQLKISMDDLVKLTIDNPEQNKNAIDMRDYAKTYVELLDTRRLKFKDMFRGSDAKLLKDFIQGTQKVEIAHDKLSAQINHFLSRESQYLKERIVLADKKRDDVGRNIILSLLSACALIMVINWGLFQLQRRYYTDGERLRNLDDRHKIAVKATNDGVFDWNIRSQTIFLSAQIFKMCGLDKGDYEGSIMGLIPHLSGINPIDFIHPDDVTNFRQNIKHFAEGDTSEYCSVFRIKHANGYWIWILARGGGVFDDEGKPIRMIGSHTDITAQKKMEERLKKDMEEAEISSKSKMDFLAHMSHEIRTPLTTIMGIAEILARRSSAFAEKERTLIKSLVTSSSTLKDLINDVLDFSKIDSGEITLEKNPIKVATLIGEVVSIMTVQAIEKNLEFSVSHDNIEELVFEGDKVRLRQILINLVGNAIKFTQQGSVKVECQLHEFNSQESAAILIIKVVDTGIGVAQQNQETIFEKFKQADDTISKGFGGTGLGLPISKLLTNMMGGTLTLESEVCVGSTFILQIPIKILNLKDFIATNSQKLPLSPYLNLGVDKTNGDAPRILLVEDYEGNIVLIGCILEDLGLGYDIARNGQEAVDMFVQQKYSAILMDLQMPKLDGLSATIKIRELENAESRSYSTPIIGMTAHATYKDKNSCLEAGMNEFITKPIDQVKLVESLIQYIPKSTN